MPEVEGLPGQLPQRMQATAGGDIPEVTLVDASGNPVAQGPVTIADGADVAQGAKADTANTDNTSAWSVVALLKGIWGRLRGGSQISANSLPVVVASDQAAIATKAADGTLATVGTTTDVAWTSGSGSLVALLKALVGKIPVLGAAATAASLPVNVANDQVLPVKGSFTEIASLTAGALNADLVPSTDVSGYRELSLQVLTLASGGTLTFQGSNDNTNFTSVLGMTSTGTAGSNPSVALWRIPVKWRYFRVRQTSWTSGSSTGVLEMFTQGGSGDTGVQAVQSGTWNFIPNVTASGVGTSTYHLVATASTNATSLKGGAGQMYGYTLSNSNAAPRYVKFYNKASAPTVGSDTPVHTVLVPANGVVTRTFPFGASYFTGIAFATTTGIADADTGAVGAGDLSIDVDFK